MIFAPKKYFPEFLGASVPPPCAPSPTPMVEIILLVSKVL